MTIIDEIFGGYPWFYREDLINAKTFPWSRDINARAFILNEDLDLNLEEYIMQNYENSIKETPYLTGENDLEKRRREIGYLNIKWFMQTLLDRMDRASMHWGLEARVPFADHRLLEYVWNVPWSIKYKDGKEKALLRDAMKDYLPKELLNRKKSPYPKTYNPNYEKLLKIELKNIIEDNNAPIIPLLNKNVIYKLIENTENYNNPWFGQLMTGTQMIAYLIQINYWLKKYNLSI